MNQKGLSTFKASFNLSIFTFFLLFIRNAVSVDPMFEACVPIKCGDQNISYPFWIQGQQNSYCGYPGFGLDCKNELPILRIPDNDYIVKDIFYDNQSLRVYNSAVLDSNKVCYPRIGNITVKEDSRFKEYSNLSELILLSNCSNSLPLPEKLLRYRVDCNGDGDGNDTDWSLVMFSNDTNLASAREKCKTVVVAPIESLEIDGYLESLRRGFVLNWVANNCSVCGATGGRCGFDPSNHFRCFCPDMPHAYRCLDSLCLPKASRPLTPIQMVCPSARKNSRGVQVYMCEVCGCGPCGVYKNYIPVWPDFIVSNNHAIVESYGKRNYKLILGTGIPAAAVLLVAVILLYCFRRECSLVISMIFSKKERENNQNIELFLKNYGSLAPKRYSYSDVKKMTNSFAKKLGQGGYGGVYKGKLQNGHLVAVKVLTDSKGNGEEFTNEVASISRTSHVNVVTLLGFCFEGTKRALIYEFMPNGSLEKFIYDESSSIKRQLGWETLYQIAVGIARGLEYLHRGCNTRILHFDIKPHNILLDDNFCPKIADFGLSKLCLKKDSIISMLGARGTFGYIAPEVFSRNFGGVSHKSDVYSYGMMVLEMVGGRKNIDVGVDHTSEIYFPHWIYNRVELDEDLGLLGIMNEEENERARKMIIVGLWCIQTNPSNRPSINKVMEMLEGSLESLQIPPKPFLSSPPRPPADSSTIQML